MNNKDELSDPDSDVKSHTSEISQNTDNVFGGALKKTRKANKNKGNYEGSPEIKENKILFNNVLKKEVQGKNKVNDNIYNKKDISNIKNSLDQEKIMEIKENNENKDNIKFNLNKVKKVESNLITKGRQSTANSIIKSFSSLIKDKKKITKDNLQKVQNLTVEKPQLQDNFINKINKEAKNPDDKKISKGMIEEYSDSEDKEVNKKKQSLSKPIVDKDIQIQDISVDSDVTPRTKSPKNKTYSVNSDISSMSSNTNNSLIKGKNNTGTNNDLRASSSSKNKKKTLEKNDFEGDVKEKYQNNSFHPESYIKLNETENFMDNHDDIKAQEEFWDNLKQGIQKEMFENNDFNDENENKIEAEDKDYEAEEGSTKRTKKESKNSLNKSSKNNDEFIANAFKSDENGMKGFNKSKIKCELSQVNKGDVVFVTYNDIIFHLPKCFLPTNYLTGNSYNIIIEESDNVHKKLSSIKNIQKKYLLKSKSKKKSSSKPY